MASRKLKRSDLKRGDHIYTLRKHLIKYGHHGIYIGDNKVIHFTNNKVKKSSSFSSVSNNNRRRCSHPQCSHSAGLGGGEGVILTCLDCFLEGGSLYIYEYGISPEEFETRSSRGTCTTKPTDPPGTVVDRAERCLREKNEFGTYHLFENNCEDFSVYCNGSWTR